MAKPSCASGSSLGATVCQPHAHGSTSPPGPVPALEPLLHCRPMPPSVGHPCPRHSNSGQTSCNASWDILSSFLNASRLTNTLYTDVLGVSSQHLSPTSDRQYHLSSPGGEKRQKKGRRKGGGVNQAPRVHSGAALKLKPDCLREELQRRVWLPLPGWVRVHRGATSTAAVSCPVSVCAGFISKRLPLPGHPGPRSASQGPHPPAQCGCRTAPNQSLQLWGQRCEGSAWAAHLILGCACEAPQGTEEPEGGKLLSPELSIP